MWDQVEAKDACLRRLDERGFPQEMRALAEASDRFYELGVYYRNPLEVQAQHGSIAVASEIRTSGGGRSGCVQFQSACAV